MKLITIISTPFCSLLCSLLYSFLVIGVVNANPNPDGSKIIYGYVEKVNIQPENITLTAKLDTGAQTASLNAIHIKEYSNNGKKWVSFDMPITATAIAENQVIHFEKQLKRTSKIKRQLIPDDPNSAQASTRPVIMIEVCIKQQCKTIEANLANRSNYKYPLLLGRNAIIAFAGIVDPSQQYTQTVQFDHEEDEANEEGELKGAQ